MVHPALDQELLAQRAKAFYESRVRGGWWCDLPDAVKKLWIIRMTFPDQMPRLPPMVMKVVAIEEN